MRFIKLLFFCSFLLGLGHVVAVEVKDFERYFIIKYVESSEGPAKEIFSLKGYPNYNELSSEERSAMAEAGKMVQGLKYIFFWISLLVQFVVACVGAVVLNCFFKRDGK